MTRDPLKRPISNGFTATGSNSVILLTWGSSYDVHYWLNLNRRSTNSPVTDCGDNALSGDDA